jgi:predicted DNA-binding ribbon-helix-helix protein
MPTPIFNGSPQIRRQSGVKLPVLFYVQRDQPMKSTVIKRSVLVAGHKTSVSLEDQFWAALKGIARERDVMLSDLITTIDVHRQHANLSSAIRLFVLGFYRDQISSHNQISSREDRSQATLVA